LGTVNFWQVRGLYEQANGSRSPPQRSLSTVRTPWIRMRNAPYMRTGPNPGPYRMRPDEVLAQLGVIAMAGSTEFAGTLGDNPDAADGDSASSATIPAPRM
jgi:hypothetical protein